MGVNTSEFVNFIACVYSAVECTMGLGSLRFQVQSTEQAVITIAVAHSC